MRVSCFYLRLSLTFILCPDEVALSFSPPPISFDSPPFPES